MANNLTFALAYRKLGYSIFPLRPGSKQPGVASWKTYQSHQASEAEIRQWYLHDPGAGIAVVTGAVSGDLVVLDCDPRHGGQESLESMGLMPSTPIVHTGGGGQHYYFKGESACIPAALPGLDIKGKGGYVVAPPSIHPETGKAYTWLPEQSPSKVARAAPPRWLQELIGRRQGAPDRLGPPPRERDWVVEALKGVSNGTRDNTCIKLCGYFRNRLPYDVTLAIMAHWAGLCTPPFSEEEIWKCVKSAYKYSEVKGVRIVP